MIEQGTPEWHALRLGKVTGSRVCDVMARIKSGFSASRANYRAELVAERLTGTWVEGYVSGAMQWGKEVEAQARAAYEFYYSVGIEQVAFVDHPTIKMAGASPDGLVGDAGLIELKCPNTSTHIEYLKGGTVPSKYELQMQFQMACTGRAWCDFVSYDPRLPERLRLFVRRAKRDPAKIVEVTAGIVAFLREVDAEIEELNALTNVMDEAA